MPLKITYHDTETHADEADGWDELIGKRRYQWSAVIGNWIMLNVVNRYHGYGYIVKDEQGHILEIEADENDRCYSATVYNPIFTMEG